MNDLASPEATAARQARIAAARENAAIRAESIDAAQRVYSKHKLRGDKEILTALQNLGSNIELPQDQWIRERIAQLCCDIENDGAPTPPEILGFDKRGEFDNRTAMRVRNGRAME